MSECASAGPVSQSRTIFFSRARVCNVTAAESAADTEVAASERERARASGLEMQFLPVPCTVGAGTML